MPIYGAASSGKTMFMMAATWQMVEGHLDKVQADFINDSDRDSYNKIWKPGFESGRVREKTQQMLPDAFLLSIRRGPGLSLSLYMYDPAGEAIERDSDIEGHRFLRYFDGLALLIDPFSLPHFARRYLEAGHSSLPPSTAQSDPIEVVHRIVNVLESQAGLLRDRQFQRRIAIIFTKADSAFFQQEFGLALDRAEPPRRWSEAGNDVDRRVRAWLRQNEPGLLQALEVRFASLRFFVASALGHESAGGGAFEPKGTLDPLCWLLSARTTLSKPLLALVAGRGAEIAAASAVFLLFVLPGYFGTYYGSGALRLLHPGGQPIPQSSGAVAPVPPSVTFLMRSNLPHPVMLGFFSQTNRARAWEGGVLSASASESYKLSCESGEKICYGAWVDSGDLLGPYWGVGRGGKQSCSHCCLTCPGIGTTIVLESD